PNSRAVISRVPHLRPIDASDPQQARCRAVRPHPCTSVFTADMRTVRMRIVLVDDIPKPPKPWPSPEPQPVPEPPTVPLPNPNPTPPAPPAPTAASCAPITTAHSAKRRSLHLAFVDNVRDTL